MIGFVDFHIYLAVLTVMGVLIAFVVEVIGLVVDTIIRWYYIAKKYITKTIRGKKPNG